MVKEETVYEPEVSKVCKAYVVQTKTGLGKWMWVDRATFPIDPESAFPGTAAVAASFSARASADQFARRGVTSRVVLREGPV